MTDFALVWDSDRGAFDLAIENAGYAETDSLETAVLLSLLLDARAPDDDADAELAFPNGDRRGWWGGDWGSLLWRFARSTLTDATVLEIRETVLDALQWLIAAQIARDVEVEVDRVARDRLHLTVTILRQDGTPNRFSYVWDAAEGGLRGG